MYVLLNKNGSLASNKIIADEAEARRLASNKKKLYTKITLGTVIEPSESPFLLIKKHFKDAGRPVEQCNRRGVRFFQLYVPIASYPALVPHTPAPIRPRPTEPREIRITFDDKDSWSATMAGDLGNQQMEKGLDRLLALLTA